MTNQASEDELREKINSALFADDFPILNDIEKDAVDRILTIIRTEKLKLLDEVIHQSTVNLKSAKAVAGWAEIRKKQLEAEL